MRFDDDLAGGIFLIRPALRSPEYAPGEAGWTINQDGSAEFNNVRVRGTLEVGTSIAPGVELPGDQVVGQVPSAATADTAVTAVTADTAGTAGHATTATTASSAGSAGTVTGAIGAGVTLPAGQLSGTVPTTTTISGNSIITGTLNAALVKVTNLDAASITVGKLRGSQIEAGASLSSPVIEGGRALYYNTPPGKGRLLLSIDPEGGTDPYGNTYKAGLTLYDPDGSEVQLVTGLGATVRLTPARLPGVEWTDGTLNTTLGAAQRPGVALASPNRTFTGAKRASLVLFGAGPTTNDTSLLVGVERANFSHDVDVSGVLTAANLQSGRLTVVPVANQWTPNIEVTFPRPFATRPEVMVTPSSSAPAAGGTTDLKWATASVTATGFVLRVLRGSSTSMEFSWLAVST
ncbi:MAG TPA: H-type lectin domain-containing protein [Streptomyces sp.]|nr:H-type lectin domain-containing protein [Streptomyces sp.]